MLYGNIQIIADLFFFRDYFQEFAGNMHGIGVEEAYPFYSFYGNDPFQESRQCDAAFQVPAIRRSILGGNDHLFRAPPGQTFGLFDDILHLPASESPPDSGYDTIGTPI